MAHMSWACVSGTGILCTMICSENMGSSYKLCGVHADRSNVDGDSIHDNDFTAVDIFDTSYCCWRSDLNCDSD